MFPDSLEKTAVSTSMSARVRDVWTGDNVLMKWIDIDVNVDLDSLDLIAKSILMTVHPVLAEMEVGYDLLAQIPQ